jgi:hypothetical protein
MAAIWIVMAFLVFVACAISVANRGVGGDSRKGNPNPGHDPIDSFLGVSEWTVPMTVLFAVSCTAILGALVVSSIRRRECHVGLLVFLSVATMPVLDPLGNWATFTVYNPNWAHFPLDWPYLRLSPLIEPLFVFLGGYPFYFFTVAAIIHWAYTKVVVPRVQSGSYFARHPLLTVFGLALAISIPLDTACEIFWMKQGLYTYTQAVGPHLRMGEIRFPLVWGFYQWWLIAVAAMLMVRDDRGQSLILNRLGRAMSRGRVTTASAGKQVLVGAVLVNALTMVPIGFYSVLRVTGSTHVSYDKFPFPSANVYDPYRDVEDAGKPGPFYK